MASLTTQLECVQCARVVDRFEPGWRAYLAAMDPDEEQPVAVAIYCPDCAEYESGDDQS